MAEVARPVRRRTRVTSVLCAVLTAFALSASVGTASIAGAPTAAAATAPTASISGRVTGPHGEPMTDLTVGWDNLSASNASYVTFANADGTYRLDGLAAGDYAINFSTTANYVSEWWDDKQGSQNATQLHVGAGAQVTGINATLAVGARISGRVTSTSGAPLAGVTVSAMTQESLDYRSTSTAADGTYTVQGLPGGTYALEFDPWLVAGDYSAEWWDDEDDLSSAVRFPLGAGQNMTGRNAQLAQGATITGVVTGPGGSPVPNATVWCDKGGTVFPTQTDASGVYTFKALRPGAYRLRFEADSSYVPEYWNNQVDETKAGRVSVAGQNVYRGIDARLVRPIPHATPSVAGTAMVGGTLTAKPGTWASGAIFEYQWLADGTAIAGATGSTFTPTAAQTGKQLRVRVKGRKSGYDSVSATSGATPKVINAPIPTISGTAAVGQTLTAKPGAWTAGTVFNYQWYAGGTAVKGATTPTFRVASAQVGKQIVVMVKGTLSGYAAPTRSSAATAKVLGVATPSFGGTDMVGGVLSARPGAWTTGTAFAYQWYADGAAVTGATGATFTLTSAQAGKAIRLRVTGRLTGYVTTSVSSGTSPKVITAGKATIAGAAKVGSRLSAGHGTWTAGTTFTYQWRANGAAITGATASAFTPTTTQRGKTLTVQVTGHLAGYAAVTLTSAATATVS